MLKTGAIDHGGVSLVVFFRLFILSVLVLSANRNVNDRRHRSWRSKSGNDKRDVCH
jgi:hypothetical protein